MVLRRGGRNEEAVAPMAQDLQRILSHRGGAAPDQDRRIRVRGLEVCGDGPWKLKTQICRHGMENGNEVVGQRDSFSKSESTRNLQVRRDSVSRVMNIPEN